MRRRMDREREGGERRFGMARDPGEVRERRKGTVAPIPRAKGR